MPFADLNLAAATTHLRTRALSSTYPVARAFADGDHWQGGAGWVGPRPQPGDPGSAETLLEIERGFVAKNAIREVLDRHIAGVVGQPIAWRLTVARALAADEEATPDEQDRIAEAEAALTTWWDEMGVAEQIQTAMLTLLSGGRVSLRLFVPPGLLDANGRLPAGDLATQLARIVVEEPTPPDAAAVIRDPATRQRAGVFAYTLNQQSYLELSYREADATVLRIVGGEQPQEVRLPLGGRLLLHDLERAPLITAPVLSQQKLLNLAYTMLGRNTVLGGFLERTLLNAQLPGRWETDDATGQRRFIPEPLRFGAGAVNVLQGAELRDERTDELKGYATPNIIYRDPVPVATFAETRDIAYRAILEECRQLHALISGDAGASGVSRQQAAADFLGSLSLTAPQVERAVRWLLETALHLAAHFAGQSGRYLDLRAVAVCTLRTGPLTSEDTAQVISLVESELLSRETGMSRVGVDDTDAERGRIDAEREQRTSVGAMALASFDSGQ